MTDWKTVQGTQENKPLELDTTSSSFCIYRRRNIERITVEDMDGNTSELWQYEEQKLTPEEFRIVALEDELNKTQLAIVELYEKSLI